MKNCTLPRLGIFLLLLTVHASATTHYVDLNSTNATPPYTDWSIAATNIQDAVDAAVDGDLVLVTNGVYATGGRVVNGFALTNRVVINKAVTVQSVNGATTTVIKGCQDLLAINGTNAVRCVYLANGAVLVGVTLTNGATRNSGSPLNDWSAGGAWCESTNARIANCVVTGNHAYDNAGGVYSGTLQYTTIINNNGGGASASILYNCTLTGNWAQHGGGAMNSVLYNCLLISNSAVVFSGSGGGSYGSTLNNCVVVNNSAVSGGGAVSGTANNCILYYNSNTATGSGSNYVSATLHYCCTVPLAAGLGNITNEPAFVNLPAGNFHLQSNSPCINVGNNAYVSGSIDFDGRPRIIANIVDIGAYEFQSPGLSEFIGWLQQYGLPTDGSADFADVDGDGLNNWQEWIAGTVPTNALSVLTMFAPSNNMPGVQVSWQSVTNKTYFLQRSTNLFAQPAFSSIQSNLVGAPTTTVFTDTTATNGGPYFYRVGVQ